MPSFNMKKEILSSKWMAKEDVDGAGLDLTISLVTQEVIGSDEETKFALHFHSGAKPMILNKTNTRILVAMFGDSSDQWVGQRVNCYNDPTVGYGGQITGGCRVRPVRVAAKKKMTPAELQAALDEANAEAAADRLEP